MEEYERAFLDTVMKNMAASIASGMHEETADRLYDDETTLTDQGRMWAQGYLTGSLAMLRGASRGNPNLSPDDAEEVAEIVRRDEGRIASQLYA